MDTLEYLTNHRTFLRHTWVTAHITTDEAVPLPHSSNICAGGHTPHPPYAQPPSTRSSQQLSEGARDRGRKTLRL